MGAGDEPLCVWCIALVLTLSVSGMLSAGLECLGFLYSSLSAWLPHPAPLGVHGDVLCWVGVVYCAGCMGMYCAGWEWCDVLGGSGVMCWVHGDVLCWVGVV